MNKTDISWCDYTWNPVTGCKRECVYCYAKKIHDRFNKTPFSDIVFHEDRLERPGKVADPKTVFVGSMSDCEYWNAYHWGAIIQTVIKCKHHKFMFLSKSANSYNYYNSVFREFPKNTMQGLTVEIPSNTIMDHAIKSMVNFPRPYLSIEPIAGGIYDLPNKIELVIVGAETGNRKGKIIPQKSWIQSIIDNVPAEKIHWKPSMMPHLEYYGFEV